MSRLVPVLGAPEGGYPDHNGPCAPEGVNITPTEWAQYGEDQRLLIVRRCCGVVVDHVELSD